MHAARDNVPLLPLSVLAIERRPMKNDLIGCQLSVHEFIHGKEF